MKISLKPNLDKLPLPPTEKWPEGVFDVEAFRNGSMSLILFAPEGNDYQTPHEQDELYIVIEGAGILEVEGEPFEFDKGDVLFVPAHKEHRFIQFTSGIKMWAVFWGPMGGELNT
jgi:mannose-6-phosphate isomerase-like protein (cupin superfamily)